MSSELTVISPPQAAGHMTCSRIRCLLAILQLSKDSRLVSSRDIAACMQVKPPTVCRILDALQADGLVTRQPYGKVGLTSSGCHTALSLQKRVTALRSVMMRQLGLDRAAGLQAALFFAGCMDEHSQQAALSQTSVKEMNP